MTKQLLKISLTSIILCGITVIAGTLDNVKKSDVIKCGVNTGLPGFSEVGADNKWQGLDVDVCRSVAAAVLGDATKVKFIPLTAKERFTALQSGKIDILSRNTTWTATRDASLGLNFAGITYYDGQGFLVAKKLGVTSAKQLDGVSVCIQTGTTTELNLADYFKKNNIKYNPITYDTTDQVSKGFESGHCDFITSDASQLYALKTQMKNPDDFKVLPEIISKEPLGPLVRQGDDEWFNIVKWSLNAMKAAEEFGITLKNVDNLMKTSKNPEVQRILGVTGTIGEDLKINSNWAYNIVKQVGNYGESFERNMGMKSPLKISRGLNNLWTTSGGLQYSPPFR